MKAFEEFQRTGVLDFSSASNPFALVHQQPQKRNLFKDHFYVGTEPTSVLDITRNPSPPTSSSTLSSSHGSGCGSTDSTTGLAATENPLLASLEVTPEKCRMGMEDWDNILSESSGQDQSVLRMILGDVEDPSLGLNKLLQNGTGSHDLGFNGCFGVMDQGFPLEPFASITNIDPPGLRNCFDYSFNPNPVAPASVSMSSVMVHPQGKPQIFNPQVILNQSYVQSMENPAVVLADGQFREHTLPFQPPAKRLNTRVVGPDYQVSKAPFLDSGQEVLLRQQLQQQPSMEVPTQLKIVSSGDDLATHQLHQAIIDQLVKASELIETGNPVLAQRILARLNHQVSPIGKPFQRASFYMKEALQCLLNNASSHDALNFSPISLVFKIGAYKSFSEISPVLQFANFTCNQALTEAVEGYDRIHIVDFDIGFGGHWASFMQELASRNGGAPSLKITAVVFPATYDEFELSFTQENLKQYASEINMSFELEILSLESLNSATWPQPLSKCEAIAVNLPISSFSSHSSSLPLALRFVKQLMPKVVITLDRSCDRIDLSFPQHLIHSLQSYTSLLESLDAVNVNLDVLQMVERHYIQLAMEKIVSGRHRSPQRTTPWRTLLLSSGFSPLTFSNFTESQAESLVQRTPVCGFHVEKKQSSLVLCWKRKDLISVSTWGLRS